jgi:hypothetical protein
MSTLDGTANPSIISPPPTSGTNATVHPPAPATTTPNPPSPTHNRKHSTSHNDTVPLDHPSRNLPIHASLPSLPLLPSSANPTTNHAQNINPLTLQPFTPAELSTHKYDELRTRFASSSESDMHKAVAAEQEDIARQIKARMEERARKEAEIEKEIGEMEKIREVERKIYRRRMGGKESG